jgi:hypothetical protein
MVGFLVTLSLLFILSNVLLVFSFHIQRVLFNPETLTKSINDQLVTDRFVQKTTFSSLQSTDQSNGQTLDVGSLVSAMSPENRAIVQQLLFPDIFLYGLVSSSVDAFLLWAESDTASLQFTWDMTPLKNRLAGEEGREALRIATSSLPECTSEEMNQILSQIMVNPSAPITVNRLCQFVEPYKEQQLIILNTSLLAINDDISPTYVVTPIQDGTAGAASFELFRDGLNFAVFYGRWGWMISLFLLILIMLIGVRSMDTTSIWVGIPLIISGMLVLALTVVSRGWVLFRLTSMISESIAPAISSIINGSLATLSDSILQPMLIHGILMLGVGGVLFAILMLKKMTRMR